MKEKGVYSKLLFRGIAGGIGTQFRFEGNRILPLSESAVLFRSSPLWTAMIAIFILKVEKFSLKLIFTIFVCLFGIACIARPPSFINFLNNLGLIDESV